MASRLNRVVRKRIDSGSGRASLAAGALLIALAAPGASAAVVLYGQENFRGRSFEIAGEIGDLQATRWNDRGSSIVITAGNWEICTDPHFRGDCRVMGPGEYPALGLLGERVSSVRPVRTGSGAIPGEGGERIILFEDANLRGRSIAVDADIHNLDDSGFNDRARSLHVLAGAWEVCTEAWFRGSCRRVGPGEYAVLPGDISNRISSLRVVDETGRPLARGFGTVTLFESNDFSGRSLRVRDTVVNLEPTGLNDRVWSLSVRGGRWELCTDAGFRGECHVLEPGRYDRLPGGLGGRVSSLRPVLGNVGSMPAPAPGVKLFASYDFAGPSVSIHDRSVGNLAELGFSNRTSSMIVYEGYWEACDQRGFAGRCSVFGPGEHRALGWLGERMSSIRRVG